MTEPSPAAIEHYNRASEAMSEENFDLAISEFDACLCSSPNAEMAIYAFFNLDQSISGKFDFFNREGASLSDYEAAWSLRGQNCLNKAIEVYELNENQFSGDTAEKLSELYQEMSESQNKGMAYGIMKYDANGEKQPRDFDAVQRIKLPPLYCFDGKPQEQNSNSFVEYIGNMAKQCGWQIRTEGQEMVFLDFSVNNRQEVIDVSYLTHPNRPTVINFASAEIPISFIKHGDDLDAAAEHIFDNYFLERNMATFRGCWGVLEINGQKNYVFVVRIDSSKLTPEEFRLAVIAILDERKQLSDFVSNEG